MLLLLAVLLLLWLKALITFLFFRCELFTREQIIIWWNISGRRLLRVNNKKNRAAQVDKYFYSYIKSFSSCSHEIVLFSSQFFNPAKHSFVTRQLSISFAFWAAPKWIDLTQGVDDLVADDHARASLQFFIGDLQAQKRLIEFLNQKVIFHFRYATTQS